MRIDYRIRNWIVDHLEKAEFAISPFQPDPENQDELNAMSKRAVTQALARTNYPCPICNGKGTLKSGDGDWVACHSCIGTGVDIETAREAMKL